MNNNKAILSSLKQYLLHIGAEIKSEVPGRLNFWYDKKKQMEIVLPADELICHEQSLDLLNDAIKKIANNYNLCAKSLKYKLSHNDSDILKVRNSGKDIKHGSIKFEDGLTALNGLYGIIKASASKSIKSSGKREVIRKYLSGVNMLAPSAGSYIHTVEFQLFDIDEEIYKNEIKSEISISRYINANLALSLSRIAEKIKSSDSDSAANFLKAGIDSTFCNNFLSLFPKNSEKLEFNFDWSLKEIDIAGTPEIIIFNYSDRTKVERIKSILMNSQTKRYSDLPAFIEKYSWPIEDEKGKVYFRIRVDSNDYTCHIETESILYERLKAEHAKKQIFITCDLLSTNGSKKSVEILKMYSIKINKNHNIPISS